jgi:hypothetical protein
MSWKECYVERGLELHPLGQQILSMATVIVLSIALTIFICGVAVALFSEELPGFINLYVRVSVPVVATVGMLGLALRAAGSFTSERERQTLDSLLTTDLTAREILVAKLLGCIRGQRNVGRVLSLLLGVGLFTFALFPPVLLLAVLALAAHGLFAACLGMYCSLVSKTTLRATVATVVALLGVTLGHWLVFLVVAALCEVLGVPWSAQSLAAFHAYGLTPPLTLTAFLVTWPVEWKSMFELRPDPTSLAPAVLGVVLYAALAGCLWLALRSRFPAVTGRLR